MSSVPDSTLGLLLLTCGQPLPVNDLYGGDLHLVPPVLQAQVAQTVCHVPLVMLPAVLFRAELLTANLRREVAT